MERKDVKNEIRERYDAIPNGGGSCCGDGSASCSEIYAEVEGYVAEADFGLGCGLPTESVRIAEGNTVLDLGSGAGNDAFVARRSVGDEGRVIGVDFAPKMIEKARQNAAKLGYSNVEFLQGDIEQLPLDNHSVDVVLSNCVLNLVPDKQQVFSEIFRVLKPGGRFAISDIVTEGDLPETARQAAESHTGCVAGAMNMQQYLDIIRETGFAEINVVKRRSVMPSPDVLRSAGAGDPDPTDISGDILSITVIGLKPVSS